jgi:predicted dehydrogenase
VRTWLGDITAVSAALPVVSARRDVAEDSFDVRFRTAAGVDGVLQQTAAAWGPPVALTRVAGTAGTLWLDGEDVWVADGEGSRRLPVPDDLRLAPPPSPSTDPRHRFTHLEVGPYTRLCEVFRAAIEGRDPPTPVAPATFVDGVAVMDVLDAVRASAAAGGAWTAV